VLGDIARLVDVVVHDKQLADLIWSTKFKR